MEQTMNQTPRAGGEGLSSWRRVGSVAAGLVARTEARRQAAPPEPEPAFAPVAWAAE